MTAYRTPHPTVVAIGASGDCLAALKTLLAGVPPDTGLAYVVVIHLWPEHESPLAEVLRPHVQIPVQQVDTTVALEPDHVYVLPPNANLHAVDTHLRLSEPEARRQERAPIDHLFGTLARTHEGLAIGVIVTGTGSDGALGLREIKEKGWLAVVQNPIEAEHDGMPRSAIATGAVDLVLPLAEIMDAVLRHAYSEELKSTKEELRSTLEELEASKEEVEDLLTASEIAILFLDRELRIQRFTPNVGELFSVEMADRGRPLSDLAHRLVGSEIVEIAQRVLASLDPIEREVKDESGRWYLTRVLPHRGAEHRIEGVVITFTDVTSLRTARAALQESEARYHVLADLSPDAILVSLDDRYVYANAAAAKLVGARDPADVVGRSPYDLLAEEQHETLRKRIRRVLEGGAAAAPVEYGWKRLDGTHVEVEATEGPVTWNGRPAVQVVARGITGRKLLEARLRQGERMRAIGHLAGGIAHDFNNLLTAVQGHATLALDDLEEDSPIRENIDGILSASIRAARLTHQLLAFSRKQDMEERPVELGRVTLDLESMLRRLVPERIDLRIRTAADDPVVRADPGRLHQLVMSLVLNAADAMDAEGSITIGVDSIDLSPEDAEAIPWRVEPGPYARLTVRDTGSGMSRETLAHVFEPFFTTKGLGQGTGLGLATVYGMVKQSHGHIIADSTLGRGTVFQVLLPRSDEAPLPEAKAVDRTLEEGGRVVLLVEDDEAVRSVAQRILVRAGYTVIEATEGNEALERLERDSETIDLVLSDIVMPGLGGIELRKRMAVLYPHLKVILMSGYSEAGASENVHDLAAAFLPKPFTPDALRQCVARTLADVT
jgi:PAS domain S-box-containing protein